MDPIECSEDYGGPKPASEPETKNIMNYWKQNGPIVGAIDWHSYGQLILHPWGEFWRDVTVNLTFPSYGMYLCVATCMCKLHVHVHVHVATYCIYMY